MLQRLHLPAQHQQCQGLHVSEGAAHQLALDLRNCMRVCLLSSIGWLLACAIRTRPGRCATLMLTDLPTPSLLRAPSSCSCSPLDSTCLTKNSCCNSNHVCQRASQSDALGNCKTVRPTKGQPSLLGSRRSCAIAEQRAVSWTACRDHLTLLFVWCSTLCSALHRPPLAARAPATAAPKPTSARRRTGWPPRWAAAARCVCCCDMHAICAMHWLPAPPLIVCGAQLRCGMVSTPNMLPPSSAMQCVDDGQLGCSKDADCCNPSTPCNGGRCGWVP